MNMKSNEIDIKEDNGLAEIKIDGVLLRNVNRYEIKREVNIVDFIFHISVIPSNLKTSNEEKETPVAGTTDVAVKASNIRLS